MIKLKQILKESNDEVYHSQKYVVSSEKLEKTLVNLRKSKEYKKLSLDKTILLENYCMIGEWVSLNIDDLYQYEKIGNCWYSFLDRNNVKHEIRLVKGIQNRYEVKLWFLDENKKPNYNPPNVYNNLKYDTRIFNTHIYILLNEIIPYFFDKLPKEKLFLPATDKVRYRLYKITLNNHLDKNKYLLREEGYNVLSVSLIKNGKSFKKTDEDPADRYHHIYKIY